MAGVRKFCASPSQSSRYIFNRRETCLLLNLPDILSIGERQNFSKLLGWRGPAWFLYCPRWVMCAGSAKKATRGIQGPAFVAPPVSALASPDMAIFQRLVPGEDGVEQKCRGIHTYRSGVRLVPVKTFHYQDDSQALGKILRSVTASYLHNIPVCLITAIGNHHPIFPPPCTTALRYFLLSFR